MWLITNLTYNRQTLYLRLKNLSAYRQGTKRKVKNHSYSHEAKFTIPVSVSYIGTH